MTKTNSYRVPTAKEIVEGIKNSPYYNIASEYWHRKGVYEPTFLHALIAFSEIVKVDNKINPGRK